MYFFYLFFLFFIFFFLIIILLFPVPYTYREIVPGLGSVNYGVNLTGPGGTTIETAQFIPLVITDGEGGSPGAGTDSAIDFGGSTSSQTTVGFIPQYLDSKKSLKGYFKLFMNYSDSGPVELLFTIIDNGIRGTTPLPNTKLSNNNNGWASLRIDNTIEPQQNLYQVNVPFEINSTTSRHHKLDVYISYLTTNGAIQPIPHTLQLYSASVYYY